MESRREQVFVGTFVLIATGLIIFIVFALTGAFAGSDKTFHAKFPNAAGLEPGASVRYAGGEKIGRVIKMQIDTADPSQIDMTFAVSKEVPVKADSKVAITSFSPLGDNHLEIKAGSPKAAAAPSGALLTSVPYVGFNDLTEQINALGPQARELIANLNERVVQLKGTIDRVDDMLNDQNRANVSASLAELHGMLKENRPAIQNTLKNMNAASAKIGPLIDQLHQTTSQASETLKHVDDIVGENRQDIHASIAQLRQALASVITLTGQLNQTLDTNSDNIDQLLLNFRDVSENLKEFTDTIKTRPSALIRSSSPRRPQTRRQEMSIVMRNTENKLTLAKFRPLPRVGPALLAIAAFAALALTITGCGASRPVKYYQLTYPSPAPTAQNAMDITLLVRSFDAVHLYKEDRIVYSVTSNEMGTYEEQRWIAPPVEMLQSALVRGLRSSGQFRGVMTVRGEGGGEYALNGYLYEFGEVDGSQVVARLNYVIRLRDRKSGSIVWTHTYNHDEPASEKSVPAVVTAMDKNVQQSVLEVNAGLAEYFRSNPIK